MPYEYELLNFTKESPEGMLMTAKVNGKPQYIVARMLKNLSNNSNIVEVKNARDKLVLHIQTGNTIRLKVVNKYDGESGNIDKVRDIGRGIDLIHINGKGWFFGRRTNKKFADLIKKKNVNNAVTVWGMNRKEAENMWNRENGKYLGGSKVKGKRVLKNGRMAGYVRQKNGSYRWQFLKKKD